MFKIFRTFLLILFLVSTTTAVYSETSWITKKSDKTKVELKKEKKEKKEEKKKWIAKKKKKIKKFKEKSKNVSKEVNSWISKKSKKDKYIKNINKLPKAEVYFVAKSNVGDVFFGYINSTKTSKKISSGDGKIKVKKNSQGYAYLNDGKTICKISSEILAVIKEGRYFGEVHAKCSNKTNFNGDFSQRGNIGNGTLIDNDGNDIFFTFYQEFNLASKTYAKFIDDNIKTKFAEQSPKSDIEVNPTGKYYALLIGNSNYEKHGQWASLTSPINDVNEIGKILKSKYKFADVDILEDATRFKIFDKLKKLKDKVGPNDYLLIYYSGHGEQDAQRGYWIPVNGEKDWDPEWIDSITVLAAIQRIKARHILLMVDSCYLGSSFKGDSTEIDLSEAEWNAEMANKVLDYRAGLVLSSGGSTPVTDATIDKKHSMFAYKFIDLLKKNDNFILSSEVYLALKKYHAKQSQTPQFYGVANWGHLDGDFVFVAKN